MKAVMYHYVREFDAAYPGFRFLDVSNFRKQLDFFEKEFGFVTRDEWDEFIEAGVMPESSSKIILTFDDAMRCHFDYVFHELVQRGLWGIFYVPTLPYQREKLLDVHRIHLLGGAYDGVFLLKKCMSLISDEMIGDSKRIEFQEQTYENQLNSDGISAFKRLLNYFISYEYRESVIDELGKILDFEFDCKSFYVPSEHLVEMHENGMLIGSHSSSHQLMSKLSKVDQQKEISDSFNFLLNLGVCKEKTYCHPYGGFISFNSETVELLNANDVKFSFNVEAREINASDFTRSRQFLPRFDCNLFQFGKAS